MTNFNKICLAIIAISIDCQGLRHRDLSDLAHRILLNTTGVGAKVKLKLQSAN